MCAFYNNNSRIILLICILLCRANATAKYNAYYGQGKNMVYVSEFECLGTESNLWECQFELWSTDIYCGHDQDLGLSCAP